MSSIKVNSIQPNSGSTITLTGSLTISGALAVTGVLTINGGADLNGTELILDADADTSITADTDDRIDIKIGGVDELTLTAAKADNLDDIAAITPTDNNILVGDGTNWVKETPAQARVSLDVPSNAEAILDTLIDAKGDILVGTAADTVARKAIGADNTVLTAASAQGDGLAWTDPNTLIAEASDTVAGKIELAIQSEMETGTDVLRAVTPGRQHFHPSAAKGWCFANTAGSAIVSYNVTSVTDGGTGNVSINWNTDFSSANHCSVASVVDSASTLSHRINTVAAGSTQVLAYNLAGALTDPNTGYGVVVYGDQ
jgi:hypothetical protein